MAWFAPRPRAPQLAVLPLGAVHNNRLVSALVNYLRTPSVPFKSLVAPVLTQLVASPHLFSMVDPPRLEPVLLGLRDVAADWRSNAERRGQVFLPKPFQVLLFSLLAAGWGNAQPRRR